tara:strand:+ start:9262 stop:9471 length:210 start_codon:yes stop_codon:yes gene_type:complete
MIKSLEQAKAVQVRRVKRGKKGIARAVRKYIVAQSLNSRGNFEWYGYNELKQELTWICPHAPTEKVEYK